MRTSRLYVLQNRSSYRQKLLHCGNRDFRPFCSSDLDLYPMAFIYEHDPYSLDIPDVQIRTSYVKAFESYRLTDRPADKTEIIYCFAGGQ